MKKEKKLNRIYWLYGGIMGLLLIALQIIHYKVFIRDLSVELFGAIVGVLFLVYGVWLGSQFMPKKNAEKYDAGKLGISKREMEVLMLLAQGYSNQEVADKLFVSLNTAKTHISNIYSKLNVKRRTQAIQKARDLALISDQES